MKFLVVDTETGGLDAAEYSILTLAAVVWNDGAIDDTFTVTIREPEIKATIEALRVNGLSIEDIERDGVTPLAAVLALENFMLKNDMRSRVEVVAHNRSFDIEFIKRLYRLAGKDYSRKFSHRGICTQSSALLLMAAGRMTCRGSDGDSVFGFFGVAPERTAGKHEALGDAIACAKTLAKMVELVRRGE